MEDIYFCTDIETDGPSPGHYSMLSFATVAFRLDKTIIGTFERNLELLPGAKQDPDVMKWWHNHEQEAWKACRENLVDPKTAMQDYYHWVVEINGKGTLSKKGFEDLEKKPVFIAYPTGFDHSFINWYLYEFVGCTPYYIAGLDITSYHAGMRNIPFKKASKRDMPDAWIDNDVPHTHKTIDDAIGHVMAFCNMVQANKKRLSEKE